MRTALRLCARLGTACLLILASCSLLVDASELDESCASDEKVCRGRCVKIADPAYGCRDGCEPCLPSIQNAIFECGENGVCQIAACLEGFGCSACSTNLLVDPRNCGECSLECHAPCSNGACTTACDEGYENCDNDARNGCEAKVSDDSENCGACGARCSADSTCRAGGCE